VNSILLRARELDSPEKAADSAVEEYNQCVSELRREDTEREVAASRCSWRRGGGRAAAGPAALGSRGQACPETSQRDKQQTVRVKVNCPAWLRRDIQRSYLSTHIRSQKWDSTTGKRCWN
jgi:hypothetical protein